MKLVSLTIEEFMAKLAEGTPFPGGGSVAALCGALGAALSSMVSNLTHGREKFRSAWADMERVREEAGAFSRQFLELVDSDAAAYREVMAAYTLPKATEEERQSRRVAVRSAMRKATLVPLETLRTAERLMQTAQTALRKGNPTTLSDAGAAVQLARAAAAIAAANVLVNLAVLGDELFSQECQRETEAILGRMETLT